MLRYRRVHHPRHHRRGDDPAANEQLLIADPESSGKLSAFHPRSDSCAGEFENVVILMRSAMSRLFNNAHLQDQRKIAVLGLNAVQTLADG